MHVYFGKSPDLWVIVSSAFPVIAPVAMWKLLPNYSGRTVQDFHLIPF